MARGTVRVSASGDDLFKLAADLRRVGARSVQRELYAAVQHAGRDIADAARDGAGELPRRGGMSDRVAGASFRTRLRGGRNPGVRVTATERKGKPVDLNSIDRTGKIRHPLFGNRRWWYPTQAPAGWFTRPATQAAEGARKYLDEAVARIEREITGR
jgi:hypothetical protein